MGPLDLQGLGLGWTLAIFAAAALVVWFAGDRLTRYANAISDRTGAGKALMGMIMLGVMVSLPEMTFSAVSAWFDNAELAVNGLVGGIGVTMVMIAITDAVVGPEPLSRDVQHPVVLLQGGMTVLMLVVAAAGITTGDRLLPGIGLAGVWTTALAALYICTFLLLKHLQRRHPWRPSSGPPARESEEPRKREEKKAEKRSLSGLLFSTAIAAGCVIAAGTVLAFTAEAFTAQTALGAGLVGLLFGGVSTSLPELSTTISAVRMKQYELAYSDAFGTNLCSVALLFVADLVYPGGPILNEVGPFSTFAVLLGCALTAIYLVGLVVRHPMAILRMGLDSLAVLFAAGGGLVLLSSLK